MNWNSQKPLTTKGDRGMKSKESLSLSMHVLWVNPIHVELSVRLYMLSTPREVRPSCELEQLETFNDEGRPRNEKQRIVVIVNACTVG